jgi:hypothetical protein
MTIPFGIEARTSIASPKSSLFLKHPGVQKTLSNTAADQLLVVLAPFIPSNIAAVVIAAIQEIQALAKGKKYRA